MEAWEHRLKFGLILKKMADYCWSKKSLKSETKKSYTGFMKMIYEQYFIFYFMNILYMKL